MIRVGHTLRSTPPTSSTKFIVRSSLPPCTAAPNPSFNPRRNSRFGTPGGRQRAAAAAAEDEAEADDPFSSEGNWQTPCHPSKFKPIARVDRGSLDGDPNYNSSAKAMAPPPQPNFSDPFAHDNDDLKPTSAEEGEEEGEAKGKGGRTPKLKEGELPLYGDEEDRQVEHYWP